MDTNAMGLSVGQLRSPGTFGHNAGWYDRNGVKVGWGDLAAFDIPRIQAFLGEGEVFITLPESDSFWNFTELRDSHEPEPVGTESNPGVEYVARHARFLIFADRIYRVSYHGQEGVHQVRDSWTAGVPVTFVSESEMADLVRAFGEE